MTTGRESSAFAVPNPGDLDLEEFSSYSLVIDARTPQEYEEDHIPGAINLPVVNDAEFAEVGLAHVENPHTAYLIGAEYALRNIASHLRAHVSKYGHSDQLLVYCFRGGKRSRVWADALRNIGFRTDVVEGGWKAYRRWVRDSLESLPPRFEYRVLSGLTGCGKTRLLHALEREGNQVLDLEGLASHRGSLIGALPGQAQPPQKLFDSLLLHKLRFFDLDKPVWVEAESKKIGNLQMPESLYDAIRRGVRLHVTAPLSDRVRLLREDYPHFVDDPKAMVERLSPLKPLIGGEELALWDSLARNRQVDELFERVLVAHYDPSYNRSHKSARIKLQPEVQIQLLATDPEQLTSVGLDLTQRFGANSLSAPVSVRN